ncbi:MAG TPA: universal stress protein [Terriglobia bacterium]|nr:universal stress protein [Terriglobia bacterium]
MVQFKTILCPVDFFKASSRAFDYALKIAANYGARVHALHVVATMIPAAYGAPFSVEDLTTNLEKESRRMLQKLKERAAKAQVDVTTEVRLGDIDLGILHSIKNQKADLVVMGTHGRRGFERLVLGSVTERMIRHCPVPLLTIGVAGKGATAPPKIRRILVTTDFSAGTVEAVNHALSIGERNRAKVTLLHVLHDVAADAAGKYRDALVRGIEVQLQKLIPEKAFDSCEIETRIEDGVPSKVVPGFAKSGSFDLLVMNIHGKALIDRALVGSTAERTLRELAGVCPVLLIPPVKGRRGKS